MHGAVTDSSTLAQVVLGTLKKLPGCNPLTETTRAAQAASRTCPNLALPPVFKTTTTYTSKFAPPGSLVTKECVLLSSSIDLLERELNLDSALQHALHRRDLQGLQVRLISLSSSSPAMTRRRRRAQVPRLLLRLEPSDPLEAPLALGQDGRRVPRRRPLGRVQPRRTRVRRRVLGREGAHRRRQEARLRAVQHGVRGQRAQRVRWIQRASLAHFTLMLREGPER